jgi:hypothetical protein
MYGLELTGAKSVSAFAYEFLLFKPFPVCYVGIRRK